jgi:hypothetical protein
MFVPKFCLNLGSCKQLGRIFKKNLVRCHPCFAQLLLMKVIEARRAAGTYLASLHNYMIIMIVSCKQRPYN